MSKRINRDDIEKFFDYGIYLPSRTVYMGSVTISEEEESGTDCLMAEKAIKGLHILDNLAPNGDSPITIILNSPGGDVYDGLAIYDAISQCKNYVTIKVMGKAQSMGAVILQAADKRIMSANASLMIHYGTTGVNGETKTVSKYLTETQRIDKDMEQLFLKKIREKKPKYTLKQVRQLLDRDTYFSASDAVDLGLADEIE